MMSESNTPEVNRIEGLKKKKAMHKRFLVILVLILIFCGIISCYVVLKTKTYTGYEVVSGNTTTDTTEIKYEQFQDKLIKYSKDGISYLDSKGTSIWTEAYSMKSPKVICNDTYVIVGDIKGNLIYLFNEKGKVDSYTMQYPICDIEVALQGVFAVVLEDSSQNYIQLFDKTGKELVKKIISINQSGYPIDSALSEDGTKLVVSYITLDGIGVKNTIAFYNFAGEGQNANSDRLVGAKDYKDTIFPQVKFMDNNTVCAIGDNQTVIYTMKHTPDSGHTIKFSKEINSVFMSDRYIGYVTKNTEENSTDKYVIAVYNKGGKKVYSKKTSTEYKKIKLYKKDIIMIGDYECTIYRMGGNQKFNSPFTKPVTDMVPNGKWNQYILVGPNETQVIKLK